VAAEAGRLRADADNPVATVLAVHERVGRLDYDTDATYVGVSVDDVYTRSAGVCQDFAHLAIAMYRSLDIPARYVSGYLFTVSDATGEDSDTDEVHVETHAWVEVALPGVGWYALDPTNGQLVGERHVTIGRGRDYDDVAPFRGVYSGPPEHDLDVQVVLRRLTRERGELAPDRRRLAAQQQQQQQQ
jgi:transglutaminase-like putative cysteine protease